MFITSVVSSFYKEIDFTPEIELTVTFSGCINESHDIITTVWVTSDDFTLKTIIDRRYLICFNNKFRK